MRSIIVGTAGHIDHGKTALVRALTGVDADRLPEEKRRGITIDLGFAELNLGDVHIGFVDVPGHERFVKNMLAGAHGIDLVALTIAADEGVMPQTREHFDICRLLRIKSGLVVITKADLVDAELLELVKDEARELIAGSLLANSPILTVSSKTGEGIEELKNALRELARDVPERPTDSIPRIPVDRAFTMRGFGTVVTGTMVSGVISEGDEVELLPGTGRARIRGLQVHGHVVDSSHAGLRTAINLGGVDVGSVERGMVLAPAGKLLPTQVLDVRIEVLEGAPRSLKSRTRVRFHSGAAELLARVRILDPAGEIQPGETGFAQLRLESPIVTLPGDHFVIRSYSPSHTIAGGQVIDAFAQKHRSRDLAHALERLAKMEIAEPGERLRLLIESSGARGLRISDLVSMTGLAEPVLLKSLGEPIKNSEIADAEGVFVSVAVLKELGKEVEAVLTAFHRKEPLARGLAREALRDKLFGAAAVEVFRAVIGELERRGAIASDRDVVRLSSHSRDLSAAEQKAMTELEKIYISAGLEPPATSAAITAVSKAGISPDIAKKLIHLLVERGELVRISVDLMFHGDVIKGLISRLRDHAAQSSENRFIDVGTFKTLAGVSRKFAIPLLEYLDGQGVTRRAGDKRLVL